MDWYREGVFKEKMVGCQANKENSPGYERMAGVCEGKCMGHSPGDEPLILTRSHSCHSYMNHLNGESPFLAEPST